jgi:hypothetical protein
MLGSATIMLGPQEDLFNLLDKHSVGLVKNVEVKTTPGFVELTQGVKNSLVYQVMNSNAAGITAEMYEYTPQNIAYGLSLDGSQIVRQTATATLATAVAAPAEGSLTDEDFILSDTTGMTADSFVLIHTGNDDNVLARKIMSVNAGTKTVTLDSGLPLGLSVGAKFEKCNVLAVGSTAASPFLSCKIVGTLANGETVPMLFPKVQISSGLSMAFKTDNFGNIPFELKIFDLVETDPHYAMFQTIGPDGTSAKGMILD